MNWIIKGIIWLCALLGGAVLFVLSWVVNFDVDPDTIMILGLSLIVLALLYNPVYIVVRAIFKS